MLKINEINVENKTVIVRCDFNVPVINNNICDDSRIKKSLKTIRYLLDGNAKVVLLSHFGKIKEESDKKKYDLLIVANRLSKLLNKKIIFFGEPKASNLKDEISKIPLGSVILLQNTRYMDIDNKSESKCDKELSKYWASLGDVYVNDAFGSSHREHASVSGIANYLPSAVGYLIIEELEGLRPLLNSICPYTIFMGGAKVESKLPIIKKILPKCDYLLLGGGILNSFLKASGVDVKDSLATDDKDVIDELKELLTSYSHKIIISSKYEFSDNKILDIDVSEYEEYINKSKTIFVNGLPGLYEDIRYEKGTKDLFLMLKESNAKVILGGGDTVAALTKYKYLDEFSFVSSGGGATLEYIADETLVAFKNIGTVK